MMDQSTTAATLVTKVENHESRITALEVKTAINETNIQNLTTKIDKIDQNISKLTWIVIAAVIAATLKVVFGGGLGL